MSKREEQILTLIHEDPLITQQMLAETLGISRSSVAGYVMKLTASGRIRGRGYLLNRGDFVVCVGGANVDLHGRAETALIAGESNLGTVRIRPGGVARNIAENLARLDVDSKLIAAVGHDANGRFLVEHAKSVGVDVQYLHRSEATATSSYLAILDSTGELAVGINDMGITEELTPQVLDHHTQLLRAASVVVADTNLTKATLEELVACSKDVPVFVDAVSAAKAPRLRDCLAGLHTLKATLGEAAAIAGKNANHQDAAELAGWLREQGISQVILSDGPKGLYISAADVEKRLPTSSRSAAIESSSGAGDAMTAALVYAWLNRYSLDDALSFAMAAASMTVSEGNNVASTLSVDAINAIL